MDNYTCKRLQSILYQATIGVAYNWSCCRRTMLRDFKKVCKIDYCVFERFSRNQIMPICQALYSEIVALGNAVYTV
jgi:hypothetical protein